MKILLLAPIQHDFPPVGYGPWELVAYNLAEGLVDLGVDVTVFAAKNANTRAKVLGYWDSPLDEKDKDNTSKNWIHMIEGVKAGKNFDLIHNHLNIHPAHFASLLSVNMVTTLHGAASEAENRPHHDYLSKDQKFISISIAERKYAPNLNYVGNVYNGVDFSKYKLSDGKGDYLLFAGRIVHDKGIEDALEVSRSTRLPLKIAGLITDQNYFDTRVKPYLNKDIEYLGNLGYEEYSKVLRGSKALLSLIHWDEPFGLTNVDALASGVPVIGYDKGSLKEIIYDSRMGSIVKDIKGAIEYLKNFPNINPKEIRDLAQNKFSREEMAKGYLEVYIDILKQNAGFLK